MKADNIHAWLLHSRPSGETSLIVQFFTRKFGIIDGVYKGGRQIKKRAMLQPFTPLWISIDLRSEFCYVRQVECDTCILPLKAHALFAAMYMNEILAAMLKPQDPSPELYDVYTHTLEALVQSSDLISIEPILRRYERYLLAVSGYAFSFRQVADTDEWIHAAQTYGLVPGTGFVAAESGYPGAHLLAIADDNYTQSGVLKTAKHIMRIALYHAMEGKPIHSRKLFLQGMQSSGISN
jgi:DNA repair protein RecO (recombination protein O)